MRSPLARLARPRAEETRPPPLAVPPHLGEAPHGLLLLRSGPAGPDIADLNRTAATLLDGPAPELLGTLLADCPLLARAPDLVESVDQVARGRTTGWRTVVRTPGGQPVSVVASSGPVPGSAVLRLLPPGHEGHVDDVA